MHIGNLVLLMHNYHAVYKIVLCLLHLQATVTIKFMLKASLISLV